jgi:hypothetical protein
MFNIGYEHKNKNGEVLATVINIVHRGFNHGWFYFTNPDGESYFFGNKISYNPLYVIKRKSSKHGETIATVTESVLAGKERWSELDSVRDK